MANTVQNCFTTWGALPNAELQTIAQQIMQLGGDGQAVLAVLWSSQEAEEIDLARPTVQWLDDRCLIVETAWTKADAMQDRLTLALSRIDPHAVVANNYLEEFGAFLGTHITVMTDEGVLEFEANGSCEPEADPEAHQKEMRAFLSESFDACQRKLSVTLPRTAAKLADAGPLPLMAKCIHPP